MAHYPKILTLYKRNPDQRKKVLWGEFADPVFEYLAADPWTFTEKVDGTNVRVTIAPDGRASYGGKTDEASISAILIERLRQRFEPQQEALRAKFPEGAILYGEGHGGTIQSGKIYGPQQDLILFDVSIGGWWLERTNVEDIAESLGLPIVPIVGRGTLYDMGDLILKGVDSRITATPAKAEGLIAKPAIELKNRAGERIMTKLKHRDIPR
jgi:hypothetical protein